MIVREEIRSDHAAIRSVNRLAFGGEYEPALIDRLRAEKLAIVSLVAVNDADIIGHILFSTLDVTMDGWTVKAAALAPVAVLPEHQRRGIGSVLIHTGLQAVAAHGFEAVFVLGHPKYYPRFGFSPALARKLKSPYSGESFMALELTADALRGEAGQVTYPEAFDPD